MADGATAPDKKSPSGTRAVSDCITIDLRLTGNPESAGINRHVVGDARALQERK